jgi:hypothetical protein
VRRALILLASLPLLLALFPAATAQGVTPQALESPKSSKPLWPPQAQPAHDQAHITAQASATGWTARRPAAAESGYRYWSFWLRKGDGSWSYATNGPAAQRPGDGDIVGFRFALSENSQQADKPRGSITFADACAKTTAEAGSKRVAVRIDFGTRADAPEDETEAPPASRTGCARLPEDGTAADALAKIAGPLRYNSEALLCAIDHYPAKGCGEQAARGDNTDHSPHSTDDKGGADSNAGGATDGDQGEGLSSGLGFAAGAAAVAILAAAALWQARRRRR